MCTSSATGAEFLKPTVTECSPFGRATYSVKQLRAPETSYSLTPEQCVERGAVSLSDVNGFGPEAAGPVGMSWID